MNRWLNIACLLFVIDRLTKYGASCYFAVEDYAFTSFLNGTYLLNSGVTFGFFASDNIIYFWILTCIICCVNYAIFAWWTKTKSCINCLSVGLFFINTGSLSNIIDRIIYAGVIDWIDIHYYNYSFPVFNFADVYIVFGELLILYAYSKKIKIS